MAIEGIGRAQSVGMMACDETVAQVNEAQGELGRPVALSHQFDAGRALAGQVKLFGGSNQKCSDDIDEQVQEQLPLLRSEDREVWRGAVVALYNLGPAAIEAMLEAEVSIMDINSDDDSWIDLMVIIGSMGTAAIPELKRIMLEHSDLSVRGLAVIKLSNMDLGDYVADVVAAYVSVLSEPHMEVDGSSNDKLKWFIIDELGDIGLPDAAPAVPQLIQMLGYQGTDESADWELIEVAKEVLISMGGDVLPYLNDALHDENLHISNRLRNIILEIVEKIVNGQ